MYPNAAAYSSSGAGASPMHSGIGATAEGVGSSLASVRTHPENQGNPVSMIPGGSPLAHGGRSFDMLHGSNMSNHYGVQSVSKGHGSSGISFPKGPAYALSPNISGPASALCGTQQGMAPSTGAFSDNPGGHSFHPGSMSPLRVGNGGSTSFYGAPGSSQGGWSGVGSGAPGVRGSSSVLATFPRLSIEGIKKELIRHLGAELPDDFWRHPTVESNLGLWSTAICTVLEVSEKDVRIEEHAKDGTVASLTEFGQVVLSHDGRMHIKAIGNLRFYRFCKRLATLIHFPGFCRDTLWKPTPVSVQKFGELFVHFIRFRENFFLEYRSALTQAKEIATDIEHVWADTEEVNREMTKQKAILLSQKAETDQMKAAKAEMAHKLCTLKTAVDESHERQKHLETRVTKIQKEREETHFELSRMVRHKEGLEDNVVRSPERLRTRHERTHETLRSTRANMKSAEDTSATLHDRGLRMEKLSKRMQKAQKWLDDHFNKTLKARLNDPFYNFAILQVVLWLYFINVIMSIFVFCSRLLSHHLSYYVP
eukprot:GHVT01043757.1.p1 GENE.GHVT01043757.1~~GHVT01043757.1.p1  ORF type:complete len:538 (+),score=29.80 GHVT01043757.1:1647-3260(+)